MLGFLDYRQQASASSGGRAAPTGVLAASRGVFTELKNICVWNKSNAGMGSLYRSKHEMVFVYRVGAGPHSNMVERLGIAVRKGLQVGAVNDPEHNLAFVARIEEQAERLHQLILDMLQIAHGYRDAGFAALKSAASF